MSSTRGNHRHGITLKSQAEKDTMPHVVPHDSSSTLRRLISLQLQTMLAATDTINDEDALSSPAPLEVPGTLLADDVFSFGSAGHPHSCAACSRNYDGTKRSCEDGKLCPHCHLCAGFVKAQVSGCVDLLPELTKSVLPNDAAALQRGERTTVTPLCPFSSGSVGHPHECGGPCKYASKARGCKDGRACSRCHLCRWRRNLEVQKRQSVKKMDAPYDPALGTSSI
mmetsp:Transcript_70465/g.199847  ORF Transcript_70465/g.199847 Transcript_70465/m.199847 type:complete len:225 (+) Transcript_70465:65-739(+)